MYQLAVSIASAEAALGVASLIIWTLFCDVGEMCNADYASGLSQGAYDFRVDDAYFLWVSDGSCERVCDGVSAYLWSGTALRRRSNHSCCFGVDWGGGLIKREVGVLF